MSDENHDEDTNISFSSALETELPNTSKKSVFAPSLFEQIEHLDPNFSLEEKKDDKKDIPEYTAEDVKGFVEFPFDISAMLTRYKGFELTTEESDRLSRLFLKPFIRTFGKVENLDWLMFGMAMASITTEKILFFKAAIAEQKKLKESAINTSGGK
jgi:hypothetical protein